jgi:hypothetical protein
MNDGEIEKGVSESAENRGGRWARFREALKKMPWAKGASSHHDDASLTALANIEESDILGNTPDVQVNPIITSEETGLAPMGDISKDIGDEPSPSEIEEIFAKSKNVVEVPAGPGNHAVQILSKPAYFNMDHGIQFIDFNDDGPVDAGKGKPTLYAAYLFKSGDEWRFLALPASLYKTWDRDYDQYNNKLLKEFADQGFPPDMTRENAQIENVEKMFSYTEARHFHIVKALLEEKALLPENGHPENPKVREISGWDPTRDTLTIVGKRNFYDSQDTSVYPEGRAKVVSNPINPQRVTGFESALVQKAVIANLPKI